MNQQDQMIWGLMLASNALYAALPLLVSGAEGPVAAVITAAPIRSVNRNRTVRAAANTAPPHMANWLR